MTRTLDLGCGLNPRNPSNCSEIYGIDIREHKDLNIYNVDLVTNPIPFQDNFFDYVIFYNTHHFYNNLPISYSKICNCIE